MSGKILPTHDSKLKQTEDGYFTLKEIPSDAELKEYYQKKYFQSGEQYSFQYPEEELDYLRKRVAIKIHALKKYSGSNLKAGGSALEIGVGEGWTLRALKDLGFNVTGVDYSDFAIRKLNPELLPHFQSGNVDEILDQFKNQGKTFDLIWLDNVLEHSPQPEHLLRACHSIASEKSVLVAEVPNDFSPVQMHLLNNKKIDKPYWVVPPDHLSYFNKNGLQSLCKRVGWKSHFFFSDFPIEVFLFNENTNYNRNRAVGKSCHNARVEFETLLMDQGNDKALNVYSALAEAGFGRQIIGIFTRE